MKQPMPSARLFFLSLACLSIGALTLVSAQTNGVAERFTGAVIDTNRGTTSMIEIVVNRWSTNAEHDKLLMTLLDQGQDKLLDVLRSTPKVGFVRRPGSLSWDLHYARRTPLPDGGERVDVVTDRPLSFGETASNARTVDYPFTLIELRLNSEGMGEGKMSIATKLVGDRENKIITLENWDLQPVMLRSVRRERAS